MARRIVLTPLVRIREDLKCFLQRLELFGSSLLIATVAIRVPALGKCAVLVLEVQWREALVDEAKHCIVRWHGRKRGAFKLKNCRRADCVIKR